jgi:hypothetical protein
MSSRGYSVFGWVVWQIATRVAKRKLRQNKVKLAAGAAVLGVLLVGVLAAKPSADDS